MKCVVDVKDSFSTNSGFEVILTTNRSTIIIRRLRIGYLRRELRFENPTMSG